MTGLGVVPACTNPTTIPMLRPCGLARGMHSQGDIPWGLGHGGKALAWAGRVQEAQVHCLYGLRVHSPFCTVPLVGIASLGSPSAGAESGRELRAWAQCPQSKALGATCAHGAYCRPSLTLIGIVFFSVPRAPTPWAGFYTQWWLGCLVASNKPSSVNP